jgi:toxin ParE1/3/4
VKIKRVVPRRQADLDIQEAFDHYLAEAGAKVAIAFVDALEQAMGDIGRHPAMGSPRYAHELNLPGLRSWLVKGFPYLIFYIESGDHVEVWRVLQGNRDIPEWLYGQE